jgi:hypothetical protein
MGTREVSFYCVVVYYCRWLYISLPLHRMSLTTNGPTAQSSPFLGMPRDCSCMDYGLLDQMDSPASYIQPSARLLPLRLPPSGPPTLLPGRFARPSTSIRRRRPLLLRPIAHSSCVSEPRPPKSPLTLWEVIHDMTRLLQHPRHRERRPP